jgi:hypothetical protein
MVIKFHDRSFRVDTEVYYSGNFIKNKPQSIKFKLDWFVRELEKCAKTIKSTKIRLSQLKLPLPIMIRDKRRLFADKINEVELTIREMFKFKKESLGYRGAGNLAIHGKQEKNYIKETFTSITFDILTAYGFMPKAQTCCFYFYFIDPRVKIIPVFQHYADESEVLLVPGLFYSHVSSGEFEFDKKQYTYFVYLVRPYQPNIPNYNSFDAAQLEEKKKKFWELLNNTNRKMTQKKRTNLPH